MRFSTFSSVLINLYENHQENELYDFSIYSFDSIGESVPL